MNKETLYRLIEEVIEESLLNEEGKKDACYHKVKARYDVWPSAYASGALSKCRKVGADNWGNKSKKKNEALDEAEITDDEKEELEDVSNQLKGAVKAHGKQAKSIDKALKKENKKNCGCGQDPCKTYGVQEAKKKAGTESSKESSLRDWFGRKGEKGSKGGWVDCNAPDGKGGYKACGRSDGEKRKKYPSCRPTPGACKEKGKGKSWGKKAAKKESLSKIIEEVIEEMNNELAEAELEEKKNSKCTKVTKKASSTRKGKKWMKCVKSDSGGYKRIHWGQAGVRVTGKSGNTKRKKSFKARHGCSKAKSNTPKGQACKDWAEE